jgi:hypothetical protein
MGNAEGEGSQLRTCNIHRTSNIQHPTSNIQHPTSNIEHRTSNIEHRTSLPEETDPEEALSSEGEERSEGERSLASAAALAKNLAWLIRRKNFGKACRRGGASS